MLGHVIAVPWAVAALVCLLSSGCTSEGTLTVVLEQEWADDVVFLEVAVAVPWEENGASCDDLLGVEAPLHTAEPPPGLDVVQQVGVSLDTPEELPSLGVLRDGTLVAARARSEACDVVGHGCTQLRYGPGDQDVRLALQRPDVGRGCGETWHCGGGREGECIYGDCSVDLECIDDDPSTTNRCLESLCNSSEDADGDRLPPPFDCDDLDDSIPSEEPLCGHGLDHDCDGTIDDVDGCGAPSCTTYVIEDLHGPDATDELLFGYEARGVFVSGDRVVAALVGPGETLPIVIWLGNLSTDGTLESVSALPLEGTEHLTPLELAVYGDTAFISHRDAVEVVDLSDATLPASAHLGRLPTPEDAQVGFNQLHVAPPFLLVGTLRTILQYDASQSSPAHGWPVLVDELEGTTSLADLTVRGGTVYAAGLVSRYLECLRPIWSSDTTRELSDCYDIKETSLFPSGSNGRIEAFAVSTGGVVFVAASHVSNPDGEPQRLLFRLSRNGSSELTADTIGVGETADTVILGSTSAVGEAIYLGVFGDGEMGSLLLRSTSSDDGGATLFLHPTENPGSWSSVPLEDAALDVAVVGNQILIAAGTQGLLVGRLGCGT